MPSPAEIRRERIGKLVEFSKRFEKDRWYMRARFDSLFTEAMRLWPNVRSETLMSYARAAYKIMMDSRLEAEG